MYVIINKEGIFTLEIADVLYEEGGSPGSITLQKNLTIEEEVFIENEQALKRILGISPGIIFTQNSANIGLFNKGNSSLNVSYLGNSVFLLPGQIKSITVNPNVAFSFLEVSSYKDFDIPVIYVGEIDSGSETNITINETTNETLNETNQTFEKSYLSSQVENISLNLIAEENLIYNISLINSGSEVSNLKFSTDLYFIEDFEIGDVSEAQNYSLEVLIEPEDAGSFEGFFNISYTQYDEERIISIPVSFVILGSGSNETDFQPLGRTCEFLRGDICEVNQICSGDLRSTLDGFCCVGKCVSPEDKGDSSDTNYNVWALGLLIFLLLGIGVYYGYTKYNGTQNKSGRERIIERGNEYKRRVSGGVTRS